VIIDQTRKNSFGALKVSFESQEQAPIQFDVWQSEDFDNRDERRGTCDVSGSCFIDIRFSGLQFDGVEEDIVDDRGGRQLASSRPQRGQCLDCSLIAVNTLAVNFSDGCTRQHVLR
jgi:hypothetical protein